LKKQKDEDLCLFLPGAPVIPIFACKAINKKQVVNTTRVSAYAHEKIRFIYKALF
jgi:hypothetical protein